jgi:puromycin-sensitive aminopeptidase
MVSQVFIIFALFSCSPEGEEHYAGVTQFEPTDARRCFPCWDEPAIKATFNVTLVVPVNKVALSNMVSRE